MADYDCDFCEYSTQNGGKCDKYEYVCPYEPFQELSNTTIQQLKSLIAHYNNIVSSMDLLGECVDDVESLHSLDCQMKSMEYDLSEDIYIEWLNISCTEKEKSIHTESILERVSRETGNSKGYLLDNECPYKFGYKLDISTLTKCQGQCNDMSLCCECWNKRADDYVVN